MALQLYTFRIIILTIIKIHISQNTVLEKYKKSLNALNLGKVFII